MVKRFTTLLLILVLGSARSNPHADSRIGSISTKGRTGPLAGLGMVSFLKSSFLGKQVKLFKVELLEKLKLPQTGP
jgi:hypothetical protein